MATIIGTVFYPPTAGAWHDWLAGNHATAREVWLQRHVKATGKPSISYDDLVEECLCFGWIDGVAKKLDADSHVQRITPRRPRGSFLSELNRQRIWKLQRQGRMTPAGIAPIASQIGHPDDPFEIPAWIRDALAVDPLVWKNFNAYPRLYRRLKIGWIAECDTPSRHSEAEKRLAHLIKMTTQNKRYGTEPLASWEE